MKNSFDILVSSYSKRLKGSKSLADIRKAIEKDLYKKYGISRRTESMAYSIADYVAVNLHVSK